MQPEATIFEAVSQYIFGGLFVFLLIYVLNTSKTREDRLLDHISKLQEALQETTQTLTLLKHEICNSLEDIKGLLQDRRSQ
jgi:hypothetical protein